MLHVFPWRNGEPMWTMETYGNPWKHPGSRMVPRHSASEDNHRQLSNMNCSMPNAPGTVRWGSPMAALWIPGTLTKGWSQGTRCMHQFSCRVQLLPGRPGFFSTFFKYTRSQALKCMEKPENIAESSMTAGMHPREKQCIHIYIYINTNSSNQDKLHPNPVPAAACSHLQFDPAIADLSCCVVPVFDARDDLTCLKPLSPIGSGNDQSKKSIEIHCQPQASQSSPHLSLSWATSQYRSEFFCAKSGTTFSWEIHNGRMSRSPEMHIQLRELRVWRIFWSGNQHKVRIPQHVVRRGQWCNWCNQIPGSVVPTNIAEQSHKPRCSCIRQQLILICLLQLSNSCQVETVESWRCCHWSQLDITRAYIFQLGGFLDVLGAEGKLAQTIGCMSTHRRIISAATDYSCMMCTYIYIYLSLSLSLYLSPSLLMSEPIYTVNIYCIYIYICDMLYIYIYYVCIWICMMSW